MKVLLISSNVSKTPYPVYPLGMSVIAGVLKNSKHQVKQIDFLSLDRSIDEVLSNLLEFKPDIIGISIRNVDNVNLLNEEQYLQIVKDLIQEIRKNTSVKIVLGGSGFSVMPEQIFNFLEADYGFVGEGEVLFKEFIAGMEQGVFPEEKIIYSDNYLQKDEQGTALYDPDIMGFYLTSGGFTGNLQTKRGCPHKCIYCSYPLLEGKIFRPRDPLKVVDNIELLINKFGIKLLFFTDSVFNDREGHYLEVLKEMKKRKISFPWTAFIKPENLAKEDVALMKDTGLAGAELGSDASTDITLKRLGKSFSFKDIVLCNNLFADFDIPVAHYIMFGTPGETFTSVKEGIENIKSLKNSVSFIFMGIRILPDTPLFSLAVKEQIITKDLNMIKPVYYISPHTPSKELERILTEGFKSLKHCVFPADALETSVEFMHKLGKSGVLWDMLIPGKRRRRQIKKNI